MLQRVRRNILINHREQSLDILRGIAVLLMILAHSIAFLYKGDHQIFPFIQRLGDTVCFITFLLISGTVSYISYLTCTDEEWGEKKGRVLGRIAKLLFVYYLAAIVSTLADFSLPASSLWLKNIVNIVLFIKVPGYTEFLLPLIFFGFCIILFRKPIQELARSKGKILIVSLIAYTIGSVLYRIQMPDFLNHYKSILVGHEDWYRFPIFQYLPVFLGGILVGQLLVQKKTLEYKILSLLKTSFVFILIIIAAVFIKAFSSFPYSESFQRWPPTISFIALGLSFSLFLIAILKFKFKSPFIIAVRDIFEFLGKRAFPLYIYHIILLQLENQILKLEFVKTTDTIAILFIILILSAYLTIFISKIGSKIGALFSRSQKSVDYVNPHVQRRAEMQVKESKSIFGEKYFILSVIILLGSLTGVFLGFRMLPKTDASDEPEVKLETPSAPTPEVYGATEIDPTKDSIYGYINRKWVLKGTEAYPDYSNLVFTTEVFGEKDIVPFPEYTVIGTKIKGSMEKASSSSFEIEIDPTELDPGEYEIQATATINKEDYETQSISFTVSYPMYVIWTLDWEGGNTENYELDNLVNFSQKHNDIPMTHFYNPSIYVTGEVEANRIYELNDWITERQEEGDEIGVHLHMRYDVAEAAGITPRTTPHWTDYLRNGQDVPTSAYTYEEQVKILYWIKSEFYAQGLGTPESFRAGGWFANSETLQALSDTGFLVDSSGRDYYVWGKNQIKGHWDLSSTTQPYQPSLSNQNSSLPYPNLSVWEFPNNGADSWYYKSNTMIDRFNMNYTSTILEEPRVVTYLSHPHMISVDIEQLEPTYEYIDKFHIQADTGPIIYTTLKTAYNDIVKNP